MLELRQEGSSKSAAAGGDDLFAPLLADDAIEELATAAREDDQVLCDSLAGLSMEDPSHSAQAEDVPKRRGLPRVSESEQDNSYGISNVARCLKNGIVCYHCGSKLSKGDVRFEYTFAKNRPPRSIHPHCLTQIDGFALNGSINFLENLMETSPPRDLEMREACESALTVFFGLLDLHNT